MQRMRWSNTGAELIRTQARDGAHLRSIDEPAPPRRRDIHIYLPAAKVADQAAQRTGGLPPANMDQNVEPPEAGFRDRGIRLRGRDQAGRNWGATIYGPPAAGGNGYENEEPDKIFETTGDSNAGGIGENMPGKAFEARMAAAIAPSDRAHDRSPEGLRGLQRLMTAHYRRRD
jgi:hypothetical protein